MFKKKLDRWKFSSAEKRKRTRKTEKNFVGPFSVVWTRWKLTKSSKFASFAQNRDRCRRAGFCFWLKDRRKIADWRWNSSDFSRRQFESKSNDLFFSTKLSDLRPIPRATRLSADDELLSDKFRRGFSRWPKVCLPSGNSFVPTILEWFRAVRVVHTPRFPTKISGEEPTLRTSVGRRRRASRSSSNSSGKVPTVREMFLCSTNDLNGFSRSRIDPTDLFREFHLQRERTNSELFFPS